MQSDFSVLFVSSIILITSLSLVVFMLYFVSRDSKEQLKTSQDKIAKAETNIKENPEKAKPAWDLARTTLEAYFSRNISQIAHIFWLSVVVFISGFLIIIWGIYQAIKSPSIQIAPIVATSAGIITEFVGATFLFIYRSTIKQAMDYSKTLERINSVGMAMQILDTIPECAKNDDIKSKTKSILVELLVRNIYGAPNKSAEHNKEK